MIGALQHAVEGASCRSKPNLQAGNEQVVGLTPQTHRLGICRQVRGKRFPERVLRGIDGQVPVFGEQEQVPRHLPFNTRLELHRKSRRRRIRPRVEMVDAGLAGIGGIGPLDRQARHARPHAEIGKDLAGIGRLDVEDRVREHHADGHGEGDVLRSQDAGVDGHVADRRLLPDIEALQLGGGFQGPFRWPEGLALPFVARLEAQHADGFAAGLPLRIDADPRVRGAGKIEAPFLPRAHRRGRAGAAEHADIDALLAPDPVPTLRPGGIFGRQTQ